MATVTARVETPPPIKADLRFDPQSESYVLAPISRPAQIHFTGTAPPGARWQFRMWPAGNPTLVAGSGVYGYVGSDGFSGWAPIPSWSGATVIEIVFSQVAGLGVEEATAQTTIDL